MKIILLFASFLFNTFALSQTNFIIRGQTNMLKKGKAVLTIITPKEFYDYKLTNDTVDINNGFFLFDGTIGFSQQFRLLLRHEDISIISEPFFVDFGQQTLLLDSNTLVHKVFDFGYGINVEHSMTNDEYTNDFLKIFDSLNLRISNYFKQSNLCDTLKDANSKNICELEQEKELRFIRKTRDDSVWQYAFRKPSSKILPWILYDLLKKYGYKEIYKKIYKTIHGFLENDIASSLEDFMTIQYHKTNGNVFPLSTYIEVNIKQKLKQNKYTLIEFWYSACSPCIAQFKALQPVYKEYKNKGFEIVAISTDIKNNKKKYLELLKYYNFPWKMLWDKDGIKSARIRVTKFPTSFLINHEKKIILIDPSIIEIERFLNENLNK